MIALAVLGGVLLAFILFKLLSGGGGSSTSTTATTTFVPRTRSTTTTTVAPGGAPAETFEVFTTKNPFLPLRGASPPAGTTATSGTTGTTATRARRARRAGPRAVRRRRPLPRRGRAVPAPAPRRQAEGPRRLAPASGSSLVDIFSEGGKVMANVKVNDTVSKVSAGQTFGGSFKAVTLSQSTACGQFLFGDEPFRLCKGEETLK